MRHGTRKPLSECSRASCFLFLLVLYYLRQTSCTYNRIVVCASNFKKKRREDGTSRKKNHQNCPRGGTYRPFGHAAGRYRHGRNRLHSCAAPSSGHHTDGTGRHAACPTKPAIARRTASLERKGYLRREPNPEDGRSQLLFATPQAEGLRNAKAETESAFTII